MTMPHLQNCPHSGDGWCLACVRKLAEANEDLIATLQDIADHDPNTCNGLNSADCLETVQELARTGLAQVKCLVKTADTVDSVKLVETCKLQREHISALESLLVCYRVGKTPPGALLDLLDRLRQALRALGE